MAVSKIELKNADNYHAGYDVVIGKWIDGRDIVRTVVDLGQNVEIPNNSWYRSSITNTPTISCTGMAENGTMSPLIVGMGAGVSSSKMGLMTPRNNGAIDLRYIIIDKLAL